MRLPRRVQTGSTRSRIASLRPRSLFKTPGLPKRQHASKTAGRAVPSDHLHSRYLLGLRLACQSNEADAKLWSKFPENIESGILSGGRTTYSGASLVFSNIIS